MKIINRILLYILFILLISSLTFGQSDSLSTMSGHIYDEETGEPLAYVNVFFSNTTLGDASNDSGYFEIRNIPPGSYDLVVNRIGYEIKTLTILFLEPVTIKKKITLKSKPLVGEEIKVEAKEYKNWFSNLEKFKKAFIGETPNAKQCKITNPEGLNFSTDPNTRDFVARSDSILHIENRALGYYVDLILEEFRENDGYVLYRVYPRFAEMQTEDENQLLTWKAKRYKTYEGSLKHFLSAFARGRIDKEKFEMFKGTRRISTHFDKTQIVTRGIKSLAKPTTIGLTPEQKKSGLKVLKFNDYLKVVYKGDKGEDGIKLYDEFFPTSFLLLKLNKAIVDSFGNLHSSNAFQVFGYWSEHRIADTLPLNYLPE